MFISLYLKAKKVEAGEKLTLHPLFGIVWLYMFAVQVSTL